MARERLIHGEITTQGLQNNFRKLFSLLPSSDFPAASSSVKPEYLEPLLELAGVINVIDSNLSVASVNHIRRRRRGTEVQDFLLEEFDFLAQFMKMSPFAVALGRNEFKNYTIVGINKAEINKLPLGILLAKASLEGAFGYQTAKETERIMFRRELRDAQLHAYMETAQEHEADAALDELIEFEEANPTFGLDTEQLQLWRKSFVQHFDEEL